MAGERMRLVKGIGHYAVEAFADDCWSEVFSGPAERCLEYASRTADEFRLREIEAQETAEALESIRDELFETVNPDGLCKSCRHYQSQTHFFGPECEGVDCPFACPRVEPERAARLARLLDTEGGAP